MGVQSKDHHVLIAITSHRAQNHLSPQKTLQDHRVVRAGHALGLARRRSAINSERTGCWIQALATCGWRRVGVSIRVRRALHAQGATLRALGRGRWPDEADARASNEIVGEAIRRAARAGHEAAEAALQLADARALA